jgi:GT2 family glycosyltransferase
LNVKGISVIIPNYNGKILLEQIIDPLIDALENIGLTYEIIVIDDCSTDDSVAYLRHIYKDIIVIENKTNSGFSITANKGIFAATQSHMLLLNNDVKLTKDYFVPLLRYFDNPDTFGVMGRIIGWDNDTVQDGGKYPFFQGVKIKTSGNYIPVLPVQNKWLYSMYLSGANSFVDREKILLLKGFDEIFSPYYIEDFELSLRAWRLSWKCYYEHFAVCRHKTSSTIKSSSSKRQIATIYNRNKLYLHAIHLSSSETLLWFLQMGGEALIHLIILKWTYIRSVYLFITTYKKVIASRKRLLQIAGLKKLLPVNKIAYRISHSIKEQRVKYF